MNNLAKLLMRAFHRCSEPSSPLGSLDGSHNEINKNQQKNEISLIDMQSLSLNTSGDENSDKRAVQYP